MSDHAGIVCNAGDVKKALAGAQALNDAIRKRGVAYEGAYEAARALQWRQMAIVSEAVLAALAFYIDRGGGSRGARAVCGPEGERIPLARTGPLDDFRFLPERAEDRNEQILIRLDDGHFAHSDAGGARSRPRAPPVLRARLAGLPDRGNLPNRRLIAIGAAVSMLKIAQPECARHWRSGARIRVRPQRPLASSPRYSIARISISRSPRTR